VEDGAPGTAARPVTQFKAALVRHTEVPAEWFGAVLTRGLKRVHCGRHGTCSGSGNKPEWSDDLTCSSPNRSNSARHSAFSSVLLSIFRSASHALPNAFLGSSKWKKLAGFIGEPAGSAISFAPQRLGLSNQHKSALCAQITISGIVQQCLLAASRRPGLSRTSAWLCRYDFQVLSAGSAAAIFMQFVFDDLACTECSQAWSLNIRKVHKDVPFGYADLAFGHNKPITLLCIEKLHHAARHVSPRLVIAPLRFPPLHELRERHPSDNE
jgi:hypothetical protein